MTNSIFKWCNFFVYCLFAIACSSQKNIQTNDIAITNNNTAIAFPSAEGFGKYTTGGRGGKTYIVTNLNDNGEGSFRLAASAKETRFIVFAVSGTIHLESPISIKGNVTIAGQSAPGDGICIADQPVSVGGDNVIIRYLRFRLGDKYQNKGKVNGSGHDDAFTAVKRNHVIIDHCSISWSNDECFSVYNGDSVTVQWNFITEPLNYSYHFETGDTDFEKHGFGGIWGGKHLTAHHNLFAHCQNRNPRFNGIRQGGTEMVDYVNNVIYNWGTNSIYAGEGGNYNLINNYFKYGPNTEDKVKYRIANPGKSETIPYGKWFINGNYVDGDKLTTKDNIQGVKLGQNGTNDDLNTTIIDKAHLSITINKQTATDAFDKVLLNGGCSFKRDSVDTRIVQEVKTRKGKIIDVQGGFAHGTAYEISKTAWPYLQSTALIIDNDKDGIDDIWEKNNGLDHTNPNDAKFIVKASHYTFIEKYVNSLIGE
jgi:hypothetical protein